MEVKGARINMLNNTVKNITEVDVHKREEATKRVDTLIKPLKSLGRLEELYIQLASITGILHPKVDKKVVLVMAGDHGVFSEGVTAFPQSITALQTELFTKGVTGVCALARQARAEVVVADVGVAADINHPLIRNYKIAYGTGNIRREAAMTRQQAVAALEVGIRLANEQIDQGKNLLGTGEMGIANTTPSSAIVSLFTGKDPEEVTGVGANLPTAKLSHKALVIKEAIQRHKPNKNDGVDVLAKIGGFEIGAMAGVMLAGAARKVPVVVDGFISTSAALIAHAIEPKVLPYLIPAHLSMEQGAKAAAEFLGFKPLLELGLCLGEGSGAALSFNIIEAATFMNEDMMTFEEAGMKI